MKKRVYISTQESSFGVIEKHRGNDDLEYHPDLGMDGFNFGVEALGSPLNHAFRNSRDTIESTMQYRDSLNSSDDDLRMHSGRDSMLYSNSRRGSKDGIRLSAMLETSSVVSFGSSPFQLENDLFRAQGIEKRASTTRELNEEHRRFGNRHRTTSIGSSVSDIFSLEEVKSSGWSKSGVTTSSGTYNLKTYTVQKFLASKMKI
ncbi:Rad21/Rec8-like protein [Cryptosporidium felis]|nr:Rad21/Rec8-like protein [Cryptosporidium felis]